MPRGQLAAGRAASQGRVNGVRGRERTIRGSWLHAIIRRPREGTTIIRRLVHDYEYIHTTLGICGNVLFVVGSVLFLETFSRYHHIAVLAFIVGSALMLIGAVGSGLKKLWHAEHQASS